MSVSMRYTCTVSVRVDDTRCDLNSYNINLAAALQSAQYEDRQHSVHVIIPLSISNRAFTVLSVIVNIIYMYNNSRVL